MAISLSNHEDRIKALENKKLEWVPLMSERAIQIPNDQYVEICRYDTSVYSLGMIGFRYDFDPNVTNNNPSIVHMIALNGHRYENCIWSVIGSSTLEDEFCHVYVSEGVVYAKTVCTKYQPDNYITMCWGLKLYYSFSYNIIYRILLRKISRLIKKLHFDLFEISSRRGGVNYGY